MQSQIWFQADWSLRDAGVVYDVGKSAAMITKTRIEGLYHITPKLIPDERGWFAADRPTNSTWKQINQVFSHKRGTLRGMHFQDDPHAQVKLVRCIRGSIHDVAVDLRPESATYKEYYAAFLTGDNRESVYIPVGFAHGYVTLEDDTEVEYLVSDDYHPELSRGYRWNDVAFGPINWMCQPTITNDRDDSWPDFSNK